MNKKKIYKDIYNDIINHDANWYELKELKSKHKELQNLLKWSRIASYPILTKEGREFSWQDSMLDEYSYPGCQYGLYLVTTKKGFKFPVYRVDFYTIVIPTNEGTICGYPADGYKFCSFISRTDVIESVEFVKSKQDILDEGLTYFGVFGDAMLKYNYSSFYHCVPVTPTMITL